MRGACEVLSISTLPVPKQLRTALFIPASVAPLVTFRVVFGLTTAFGGMRFWANGWIEKLYLEPGFFFKFYGFAWVHMPGEPWIYWLTGISILSALGVAVGLFYRLSALLFFLSFTWLQLIDATNYLNHYYLVCLLAFLLIFLPAGRAASLDVWLRPHLRRVRVPAWCVYLIIFQLCCVYFFAGLAKLNYDWLVRAMPMAVWLPERTDTPLLGYFFQYKETAYLFSWAGAIYDLTIWVFLLNKGTRTVAYLFVVVFHVLTKVLFNIGLFPLIMIGSTLIFFSDKTHEKAWNTLFGGLFGFRAFTPPVTETALPLITAPSPLRRKITLAFLPFFVFFQLLFPLRHLAYPGDVVWTEEAYRFGWRVMLAEKSGTATFYIEDSGSNRRQEIINGNHLTFYQEKQMAIQADFILQYAHYLADWYEKNHGFTEPIVTVQSYVALNARPSRRYIDPNVNLAKINDTFAVRKWVLR